MKQFIVDAFTDRVFSGNPAAVCIVEQWPEEALMQRIAMENNLSETAFACRQGAEYAIRWFTPGGEIDFCGHATLATASVILRFYAPELEEVAFSGMIGRLTVRRQGEFYEMELPRYQLAPVPVTADMEAALGARPEAAYLGRDLLCVFPAEETVRGMTPDQERVKTLEGLLCHVTAPGKEYDCVSRTFAPKLAVAEDPVCGSGHCHIAPYWAERLGKNTLLAYQASPRGGELRCRVAEEQVFLSGKAALFSVGELTV